MGEAFKLLKGGPERVRNQHGLASLYRRSKSRRRMAKGLFHLSSWWTDSLEIELNMLMMSRRSMTWVAEVLA